MTSLIKKKLQSIMNKLIKTLFFSFIVFMISCTNVKTKYWENGNIMSEIEYSGKLQNGSAKWYFQNGNIQMQANYKNGLLDGSFSRWFANGQKEIISNFKNGKKNGFEIKWTETGVKISEINYVKDSLNGKYTLWYPDGNLQLVADYRMGNYEGLWIFYNKRGFIISKATFNNGNGLKQSFDLKGNIILESNFRDNLKEGDEKLYDSNGKINLIRFYKKGKIISEKKLNDG
jgi:antitoxin component YwqK of YwqJK toxin-antitoxin module